MPQLHDSGNHHSRKATQGTHLNDFARIFGLETEYGLSVTGSSQELDIAQVAMTMFAPIVRQSRSTNTYLDNGSRLYLDVGSHPEYATAEARTAYESLLCDAAGEGIMRDMALRAQGELQERLGKGVRLHLFKNNADSVGHSFGCHENYLLRRRVALPEIKTQFLPFLISRQIYTGAGRVEGERLYYTQRATFVDETVSSATTRSRPMVNTRDEPHANPDDFRRLHVIIGDSNRSQWATCMKLATSHLVLCVIEDHVRRGVACPLAGMELHDPIAANLAVNEEGPDARLELADGSVMTALEMQDSYLATVGEFVQRHEELKEALTLALPLQGQLTSGDELQESDVLQQWQWVLERLDAEDLPALASRVDWAAKKTVFEALLLRRGTAVWSQLRQLDLDYHDIANGKLYDSLVKHGSMITLAGEGEVARAVHEPPQDTRAVLRGRFVKQAQAADVRYSCDWTELKLLAPYQAKASLMDPFSTKPQPDYEHLMALMAS